MVGRYKELMLIYILIAVLYMVGTVFFLSYNPGLFIADVLFSIVFFIIVVIVLTKIAGKKFEKEVYTSLYNCHIREYMDKLDRRLGSTNVPRLKSSYSSLSALGYIMLGDYDAVYDCCQKITAEVNKPDYYRFMITFYISKGLIDQADKMLCEFKAFRNICKSKLTIKLCDKHMADTEYAVNINKGILDGAEEYYSSRLKDEEINKVLLSKVSFSYTLGKILVLKGENERAKEYLQFAAQNGGDTKFTVLAEKYLAEI